MEKSQKKTPKFASYEEEANYISMSLMNSEHYCFQFFFQNVDGEYSFAPIMHFVIDCMRYSYGIEVSESDFATVMYEKLWDEGKWTPLKTVSGKYSFFTWLYTVAFHTMVNYLESLGYIKIRRERTPHNTVITLNQFSPESCKCIIDDVMPAGKTHDLLVDIYVEKKTDVQIMNDLHVDTDRYKKIRKQAEIKFKDKVLRSNSPYEDYVLTDKNGRKVCVSTEDQNGACEQIADYTNDNLFGDVFGVNLSNAEVEQVRESFIKDFIEQRGWKKVYKTVFLERRNGTSSAELADRLGCRISGIYNYYSRANEMFYESFREWYWRYAS